MFLRNLLAAAAVNFVGSPRRSKLNTLAAAMIGVALVGGTKAEATTYAVSLFGTFGTNGANITVAVGGSITTDGTLGTLSESDIIDWDLIGTYQKSSVGPLFDLTGPLSGNNSSIFEFANITATPLTLVLSISGPENADLIFTNPGGQFISFVGESGFGVGPNAYAFGACQSFDVCEFADTPDQAGGVFADGKEVPTTPLPAALPLFATGLGGLGLLGWRRKRKASAVAA